MNETRLRLKELRNEAGITRAELSREVGINQGTLANYENGIREADYKTLIILADFFNESLDYLLSRSDNLQSNPTALKPLNSREKSIIKNFRALDYDAKDLVFELLARLAATSAHG